MEYSAIRSKRILVRKVAHDREDDDELHSASSRFFISQLPSSEGLP
jgi:hypothetical protein